MINEVGSIRDNDNDASPTGNGPRQIPASYWHLSAALYGYLYAELTRMGIDVVGESQLVGYPTQFPSVSMVDWKTGKPNPRFWVLKLIHDYFAPGDKLVQTRGATGDVLAQAFVTPKGRALLVVNKRNMKNTVRLKEEWKDAEVSMVDSSAAPHTAALGGSAIELGPFAVAVVFEK